jgi:hypothetical protein
MTTDNTIDQYLYAMREGGARQYLFRVWFMFPALTGSKEIDSLKNIKDDIHYYVRTSSLPESTYEDVSIPYPGYAFKMAGNRTYNDWTVSLNIDKKNDILKTFQAWHNYIYDPQTHEYAAPMNYMLDQTLQLLGPDLEPTSEYTLYRAWPKSIGNVQMDYSSTELTTVDITFAYQYYICKDHKI